MLSLGLTVYPLIKSVVVKMSHMILHRNCWYYHVKCDLLANDPIIKHCKA